MILKFKKERRKLNNEMKYLLRLIIGVRLAFRAVSG